MKLSLTGQANLAHEEGVRGTVYDDATGKPVASWADVKGYPTIALGRRILDSERAQFARYLKGGEVLSGAALASVIADTIAPRERQLSALLTRPVKQGQFDALFSFMYNVGGANKTFLAAIAAVNRGDFAAAQHAIANGTHTSKGETLPVLVARRAREAAAFAESSGAAGGGLALLVFLGLGWFVYKRFA